MSDPASAAASGGHAAVRAVVLSRAVGGGRGGLVNGRGRRLGRPRDALHHVVVRSQFHLEQTIGLSNKVVNSSATSALVGVIL